MQEGTTFSVTFQVDGAGVDENDFTPEFFDEDPELFLASVDDAMIAAACLNQQNGETPTGCELIGKDAACRTCSNNDEIVTFQFHVSHLDFTLGPISRYHSWGEFAYWYC